MVGRGQMLTIRGGPRKATEGHERLRRATKGREGPRKAMAIRGWPLDETIKEMPYLRRHYVT